jgi:hypothetical protein
MNHEQLKRKIEVYQRKADKAAGALQELMKRLKDDFGCTSLKEAEKLLERMQSDHKRDSRQFEKDLQEFEEEYGDALG